MPTRITIIQVFSFFHLRKRLKGINNPNNQMFICAASEASNITSATKISLCLMLIDQIILPPSVHMAPILQLLHHDYEVSTIDQHIVRFFHYLKSQFSVRQMGHVRLLLLLVPKVLMHMGYFYNLFSIFSFLCKTNTYSLSYCTLF